MRMSPGGSYPVKRSSSKVNGGGMSENQKMRRQEPNAVTEEEELPRSES